MLLDFVISWNYKWMRKRNPVANEQTNKQTKLILRLLIFPFHESLTTHKKIYAHLRLISYYQWSVRLQFFGGFRFLIVITVGYN